MSKKLAIHKEICAELSSIYERKNNDYGDSFSKSYAEYGDVMSAIRLEDKLNRYKSLIKTNNQMVKDESIEDTLLDLANYAIMTVIERRLKEEMNTLTIDGSTIWAGVNVAAGITLDDIKNSLTAKQQKEGDE